MKKFFITWEKNGQKLSGPFSFQAETIDGAKEWFVKRIPDAENVFVRTMTGVLDERIREHISKLKGSERVESDPEYRAQVRERLRCCADAAYMFGEQAQESLERTLHRMVECNWEITGLDSHMFSFGFKSPAGFWGGIIFHCNAKEWSAHT